MHPFPQAHECAICLFMYDQCIKEIACYLINLAPCIKIKWFSCRSIRKQKGKNYKNFIQSTLTTLSLGSI